MTRIRFRKILRPLDLGDYEPEYSGQVITVWVNPPISKLGELSEAREEVEAAFDALAEIALEDGDGGADSDLARGADRLTAANAAVYAWYSDLFSQDKNVDSHWTPEEVKEVAEASAVNDPGLWSFITGRAFAMALDYRTFRKKK